MEISILDDLTGLQAGLALLSIIVVSIAIMILAWRPVWQSRGFEPPYQLEPASSGHMLTGMIGKLQAVLATFSDSMAQTTTQPQTEIPDNPGPPHDDAARPNPLPRERQSETAECTQEKPESVDSQPTSEEPDLVDLPFASEADPTPIQFADLTRKQRAAVRRQATLDYRNARGTAHLQILVEQERRLVQEIQQMETDIGRAQEQMQAMDRKHVTELQHALELHLVRNRFEEAQGIGKNLRDRILAETGATRLEELRHAQMVPGVGQSRMLAIQDWISNCQANIPRMLQEEFPGRAEINRQHHTEKNKVQQNMQVSQQRLQRLKNQLEQLHPHLIRLKDVKPQTYVNAAAGSSDAQQSAKHHTVGLFPAWEPVPSWFAALVEENSRWGS